MLVCVSVCVRVCICVSTPLFSVAVREQLCGVCGFSFSFNLHRSSRNLELRRPDLPSAIISLVPKINTIRGCSLVEAYKSHIYSFLLRTWRGGGEGDREIGLSRHLQKGLPLFLLP